MGAYLSGGLLKICSSRVGTLSKGANSTIYGIFDWGSIAARVLVPCTQGLRFESHSRP